MYNILLKVFLVCISISYIFLLIYDYRNYDVFIIVNAIFVTVLSNLISLYFLVRIKYKTCGISLLYLTTTGTIMESSMAFAIITSNFEGKWSTYGFIIYSSWIYLIGILIYYKFVYLKKDTKDITLEYTELEA